MTTRRMTRKMLLLLALLASHQTCTGLTVAPPSLHRQARRQPTRLYSTTNAEDSLPEDSVNLPPQALSRRQALAQVAAVLGVASLAGEDAWAASDVIDETSTAVINVQALSDLPPVPADCVRLYLCRHGQTENNRLKLIQGARVDAPINDNGKKQAERLGQALAYASPRPEVIYHSSLTRARETATLASQQFTTTAVAEAADVPPLRVLPELGEIDFGGIVEGLPVEQVRSKMLAAYSSWATGAIDTRMVRDNGAAADEDAGESFRDILQRVQVALVALTQAAERSESRAVAAVAHSTYLRILLATVQELPLVQISTMEQKNCCVNVLDIKVDGSVRSLQAKSNLFGGALSRAPESFGLDVPLATVLRTNEKRHLGDLA